MAAISVSTVIDDSRDYTSDILDEANDYIDKALKYIDTDYPRFPQVDYPTTEDLNTIELDDIGAFDEQYNAPTNNVEVPTDYLTVSIPEPMLDITPPADFDHSSLWSGDVPIWDITSFNKTAPSVSPVSIPDIPPEQNVPYPDLTTVVAPTFDGVTIPGFNPISLAQYIPSDPPDVVTEYKDIYANALPEMKAFINTGMTEFLNSYAPEYENNRARLVAAINNAYDNGTGLNETVEQNMYDRGRSRTEAEIGRLMEEASEGAAKRGHYVPDGASNASAMQAQIAASMANAQHSSEVTIERAKLELTHLQFIMQLSNSMKDTALQVAMQHEGTLVQVNGQALEHAKVVANVMVESYNLELKRLGSMIEYYKAQAAVYEVEYKAAMANLEIFRVEAEVAKLNADLNQVEVDFYSAQWEAQKIRVDAYAARISGLEAQIRADVANVSAYGEEVQAYSALVGAKSSEYKAYSAALDGNKSLVDVYRGEIDAYTGRIDAEKSKADTYVSNANAKISYNQNLADQFKTEVLAYTTEIQAESNRFDSTAKTYANSVQKYRADLEKEIAELNSQLEKKKLETSIVNSEYENISRHSVQSASVYNTAVANVAKVALGGAEIYSNIAGASLASNNSMVTLSEKATTT